MFRRIPLPSATCPSSFLKTATTGSSCRLRMRQSVSSEQLRLCSGASGFAMLRGSRACDFAQRGVRVATVQWNGINQRARLAAAARRLLPRVQTKHFVASGYLRNINHEKGQPDPPKDKPAASRLGKILPSLAKNVTKRENINTIPNWLTASRLVVAPFVGYCILHDHHSWALGLFAYAGITDLLDGWIARKWKLQTVVGTVIDPMADKILMTILTVALATKGLLPVWLAVIILGRDVALAISAIYYRWISLPPPKTFTRYWDFSLPSAEVRPTAISKYNTAFQLGLMGLTTLAPVIPTVDLVMPLVTMQYIVATTTIWSGASYVYSKDAVKILPHHSEPSTPSSEGEKKGEEGEKK